MKKTTPVWGAVSGQILLYLVSRNFVFFEIPFLRTRGTKPQTTPQTSPQTAPQMSGPNASPKRLQYVSPNGAPNDRPKRAPEPTPQAGEGPKHSNSGQGLGEEENV